MDIDCSKYYVGSRDLETNKKIAYQNGKKIENDLDVNNELKLPETLVEYDFGGGTKKITIESREEFNKIVRDIKEEHGEGVMISISGLGLDFLKISKGALNPKESKTIETKVLTPDMKVEILKREQLVCDDKKNILNHSFVNEAFGFEKEFEKAAYGYAKYLNNDVKSVYDDNIFYNLHNEELYHKEVSGKMYDYASNVLSYFMMGNETEEDKRNLSNDLASASLQYAKNIANGNNNINLVDTKIRIGDKEITYGQLHKIQGMLEIINEAGVRAVYSNEKDSKLNYLGLGNNYDTVAYAQLGLRTAQVNYFADNNLSDDASKLLKSVWNERLNNTIEEKYIKPMQESFEIIKRQYGVNLSVSYNGSKFQEVYEMFSNIRGNSKEEFLNRFKSSMDEYNNYRLSGAFIQDGYVGTVEEKEQLDYLEATKDIIFR